MDPLDTMTASDWRRCYNLRDRQAREFQAELHDLRQTSRRRESELVDRLRRREARARELEEENEKLRRQLDTAHGKRPGTWDTWEEHAARKQATPPEPPPKPILSLEEARKQAAEHAARARDIAKEGTTP